MDVVGTGQGARLTHQNSRTERERARGSRSQSVIAHQGEVLFSFPHMRVAELFATVLEIVRTYSASK